jgi:hypothetical protein
VNAELTRSLRMEEEGRDGNGKGRRKEGEKVKLFVKGQ